MDFKQLMKQPDLGKKIVELRKAKGLTQEELVGRCNLNVRTLQRIEAGEVTPRSFTIRTIFGALDFDLHVTAEGQKESPGFTFKERLEQLYSYSIDLFNLRTNTMKKISILTVMTVALGFALVTSFTNLTAQSEDNARKAISENNRQFIRNFNNGDLDSLVSLYDKEGCLVGYGCGETIVRSHYSAQMLSGYKFKSLESYGLTVNKGVAVEKGKFTLILHGGPELSGEYITEWKYADKKWRIVSDMANITNLQGADAHDR